MRVSSAADERCSGDVERVLGAGGMRRGYKMVGVLGAGLPCGKRRGGREKLCLYGGSRS